MAFKNKTDVKNLYKELNTVNQEISVF